MPVPRAFHSSSAKWGQTVATVHGNLCHRTEAPEVWPLCVLFLLSFVTQWLRAPAVCQCSASKINAASSWREHPLGSGQTQQGTPHMNLASEM